MRIGLFGGTFNPIHYGHLRAAKEVCEGFHLKNLYVIPSALPPHKDIKAVASVEDRLEMTRLAIENTPEFILSDIELQRPGLSYTIDTVTQFKNSLDANVEFFLVMGIDAFLEIDTWKSFKQLFRMLSVIVMTRPLPIGGQNRSEWENVTAFIQEKISGSYKFSKADNCYYHETNYPVYRFNITMLDISATNIRKRIQRGQSIRFLVPDSVANYIYDRGIFI